MERSLEKEVNSFVAHIESLAATLPLVVGVLGISHILSRREKDDLLKTKGSVIEDTGESGISNYRIDPANIREVFRASKKYEASKVAIEIIPRSFIVSLVSEFDSYIGRLISTIFFIKPELLNASEKNLSFSQLLQFKSLEEAREYLVEKEVESVLRDSHADQFSWLEKKLDMPLRSGLEVWPRFIELTERRNLFVHRDGIVSSQYINTCKQYGATIDDDCQIGHKLTATTDYFRQSFECIYEIGVKLAHVIWRKLLPTDVESADTSLNFLIYELLQEEHYSLAKRMSDFAVSRPMKHSNEERRLYFLVNQAIAYKWGGEGERAREIISSIDWSAYSDKFRLASAVLLDDYEQALRIMRKIGSDGEVGSLEYSDWPAFRDFRTTEDFQSTYEDIFGERLGIIRSVVEHETSIDLDTLTDTLLATLTEIQDKLNQPRLNQESG